MKRFRFFFIVLALLPVPVAPGTYEQPENKKTATSHRQNDNETTTKRSTRARNDNESSTKRSTRARNDNESSTERQR